jgi:hypothetical protein
MIVTFQGVLEVDTDRGVIYFHRSGSVLPHDGQGKLLDLPLEKTGVTVLRICQLEIPDSFISIDVSHMYGASYNKADGQTKIRYPSVTGEEPHGRTNPNKKQGPSIGARESM